MQTAAARAVPSSPVGGSGSSTLRWSRSVGRHKEGEPQGCPRTNAPCRRQCTLLALPLFAVTPSFQFFFCKCHSIAVLWCQVLWPSHLYRLYDSPFFFSAFFDGLLLASELQYHSEEGKGCSFGCAVAAIFCLKEKDFVCGVLCSSTYDRIVMLVYFFSFEKFASWSAALTELRHL